MATSYANFIECASEFALYSMKFELAWSLVTPQGACSYLRATQTKEVERSKEQCLKVNDEDELSDLLLEDDDPSCLPLSSITDKVSYEYHIVFSESYQQPVLYFNAYHQDGSLLSLDDIWANVAVVYQDRLDAEKWSMITQEEHPLLGRPFFCIHPCRTDKLMLNISNTKNYLVSWLSVFGPLIGLNLPVEYAEIT